MPASDNSPSKTRSQSINLRASREQKILIDQAARVVGRSRSEFILETVCSEAKAVLLGRRSLVLAGNAFKRFTDMLDTPPDENRKLSRLLQTKPPW